MQHFLEAQQWEEANQEIWNIVRQVAGESQGSLDPKSFKDVPCAVISEINKLWFQYSNGKFGFSVQREIWRDVGSPVGPVGQEDILWERFTNRVRWQGSYVYEASGPWVGKSIFSLQAPVGHLPIPPGFSIQDYQGNTILWGRWTDRWRELNAGLFSRCDMPADATSTLSDK
ncbi:GUN4 domain-containing protein [Leptodesmis sp.]|uniref:GUN4 domain-containing protein n=1 Tax=Leptodesmis sp. TaxID=3100501 RepID=UPI0040534DC9